MPYIKEINPENGYNVRKGLREGERALSAGELNYQIFYFIKHNNIYGDDDSYVKFKIKNFVGNFLGDTPNYQKWNDMTGVLVRCYREIERRLDIKARILLDIMDEYDKTIGEYEDLKIIENGDVE